MTKKQIALEVVTWILTAFLILMFFNAGIRKFNPDGLWALMFRNFGFPVWFLFLIGALEVGGAVLLIWPRTTFYGALSLATIMVGAIITMRAHPRNLPQPIVALLLCSVVAALRWKKRLQLSSSQSAMRAPSSSS